MKSSPLLLGGVAALVLASCNPSTSEKAAAPSEKAPGARLSPQFFNEVRPGIFFPNAIVANRVLSIKPLKERQIAKCGTTLPTAPRVVKLRIGDNGLKIKQLDRAIVGKKHSGGSVKTIPEPPINALSTPFDMIMNADAYGNGNNYVALKIILKDDDITFPDDENSITTVYESTETEPTIFKCLDVVRTGEDVNDNQDEHSTHGGATQYDYAIVYIDRSVKKTQKFNIRLVVTQQDSTYIMPVILDPNIKNDG